MKHLFTLVGSLLITGMLLCSGGMAYAQDLKVSGKVTDASNGSPLIGATVYVKGTTNGTATNLDGMFSLTAPKGSTLVISSVGYTTQEVVITGEIVNVTLTVSTQQLQEVVVIGYGTVKKSDATGSVVAVTSDDFNKGAITSPQDLLVGKSAGVVITNA
ncbi:MAG TPA: carboxypeptidase-like regulatory domain-containing protein, partial [Williamwhitmania sp.]|nr:carboxypeptidase-like regulatory domain-containing protein [Williamwhitmania sp.]